MRLTVRHETDAAAIARALQLVTEEYQRVGHMKGPYIDEKNAAPRVFNCYDDAGRLVGTGAARIAEDGFRVEHYFDTRIDELFPDGIGREDLVEFTQMARRPEPKYAGVFIALLGACLKYSLSIEAKGWFLYSRPERLEFMCRHGFPGSVAGPMPAADRIPPGQEHYFRDPPPRIYVCHGPEAFRFPRRWMTSRVSGLLEASQK